MNDGVLVEVIHGGHEPILEFLLGDNANVAQHGARKFGKEALDEVEPGAVLRRKDKFKAVFGPTGKPSSGLFGDVGGMIVEDQLDRGSGLDRRRRASLRNSMNSRLRWRSLTRA